MLNQVRHILRREYPGYEIQVTEDGLGRGIVTLSGDVDQWQQVIDIAHRAAAVEGVRNVVSALTVGGQAVPKKDYSPVIEKGRQRGVVGDVDVVIIGLGLIGCGVARELSKYQLNILAIDKADDVSTGASKANNGGIHMAGQVKPGTLKAKLSVRGNELYDKWAEELNFELARIGALTYVDTYEEAEGIFREFMTAVKNHDKKPQLLDAEAVYELEPSLRSLNPHVVAAVWLPSQAKIHPYEAAVALVENAVHNDVNVMLNTTVGDIITEDNRIAGVVTDQGIIRAKYVINVAGVYADEISAMAGDPCFTIHPRKGTLIVMDKSKPPLFQHLTIQYTDQFAKARNVESKGGGMDFTPSGNILLGPSATEVMDKEDCSTTPHDFSYAMGRNENPAVSEQDIIRIFAGVRPCDFSEDFVIEMSPITKGFMNIGAIQSPGITAAPAIAEMAENLLIKEMGQRGTAPERKVHFDPVRPKPVRFSKLSRQEQDALIRQRPEYGRIVCRCESITEGEILDAIRSDPIPRSIDAIKQRVRAGMGRCNGGFCQPRVLEILARELGCDWTEVNYKGPGTNVLLQKNRP